MFDLPASWPCAYPASPYAALYRQQATDFIVEEELGFVPEGQGEQVFVWVEKNNLSTAYVAEQLARLAQIHPKQVSYSGIKDRTALTRQWFSLHLAGQPTPDAAALSGPGWQVLTCQRHPRKLKRGTHRYNRFVLRLTLAPLSNEVEPQQRAIWLAERWQQLSIQGVPNYFGPQRFGVAGRNLHLAQQLMQGRPLKRQQKSFALSALRSALFNDFLAQELRAERWDQALAGDIFCLRASRSYFAAAEEEDLALLQARLDQGDLDRSGPLVGAGESRLQGMAAAHFAQWQEEHQAACRFLSDQGLKSERRPLRVALSQPSFNLEGDQLQLGFALPSGSFATAVLAELLQAEDAQLRPSADLHQE
ncbi:tRNA pseudouridine(13) synthase TruD [Marinospirillum sp.]|uniref:tRNA pseudouridine(13) synthase TruD n=1 Tax=Marinospirillum sp. TaxID=2183934 RepID=UPI003A8BD677